MCDQCRISYELQKLRKNRLNIRRPHNHLVGNAGKLCDLERDRHLRIDKCTELVRDFAMFYFHRTDLDDLILDRAEPGCLQVEDYIRIIQRLSFFIYRYIGQVIYQISFHTIDNFERIVLVQRLNIMIGIRECLNHTMIRDRHRRMSPAMRLL